MNIKTVGSVCSGIEAASVAWKELNFQFLWFSEIAEFPSKILKEKYPDIPNLGDMNNIPNLIKNGNIESPDLICGGTPCQAFSLAGLQNGLNDDRGNLTLKFVDIITENDNIRKSKGLDLTTVFWENVEGVLKDKTNAFGCFISSLAGFDEVIVEKKWSNSGIVKGPKRNVAWRLIDAKYFGLPQQRKRLYVIACDKKYNPENVLFEEHNNAFAEYPTTNLIFEKDGHKFEAFREYTDCLYAAYGTKWNGNAAATNGSLFVVQDGRLRRLSPLECERLMGFPDNYTSIKGAKKTQRYQAVGNSWAVPVVKWLGNRLVDKKIQNKSLFDFNSFKMKLIKKDVSNGFYVCLSEEVFDNINCSTIKEEPIYSNIKDLFEINNDETIFISPVGCYGILRRKTERNIKINKRLEEYLLKISATMNKEEIEKKSRIQKRGRLSETISELFDVNDIISFNQPLTNLIVDELNN